MLGHLSKNKINKMKDTILSVDLSTETSPIVQEVRGREYIEYSDASGEWKNLYPNFLIDLYNTSSTHAAIVNTTSEMIAGEDILVDENDNLEQFFFTADSLEGKWEEHPNYKSRWGNESRPGGRFFKVNEEWYLPVQNRTLGYGTGISIHKLENNSRQLELTLAHKMYLGPQPEIPWFNRGMHHLDVQLNEKGYYMVYDGDRNTDGEKAFQYKRTLKFNFIDIYNLFQ